MSIVHPDHDAPHVLVLGGTGEAAALAEALADRVRLTTSFAGATRTRRELPGRVVVGGFGGAARLRRWLDAERVDAMIDATHPFAARIARNAARAAAVARVPRLKLWRPPWQAQPGDRWLEVDDVATAVATAAGLGRRPLVGLGGRGLAGVSFAAFEAAFVRAIERPPIDATAAVWLEARGPFSHADERALFAERRIDVVVTKNAGGEATRAKLDVARERGLPVVMVRRPTPPAGPLVTGVEAAIARLDQLLASRQT